MVAGLLTVEAPTFAPAKGGLLAVANVIPGANGHILSGVVYDSPVCGTARALGDWCDPDEDPKVFDGLDSTMGAPFGIYKGIECGLFSAPYDTEARRSLELGASVAIETGVQISLLNVEATDITPTPGTAVTPTLGLGLLEQHAGTVYGGLPTLHVNRLGTVVLGSHVRHEGDTGRLYTRQGTPIANGAGYGATGPGGGVAAAGEFWMYMTGQVNLWMSDIIESQAPNPELNRSVALAEQIVVPTVECFVAAVLVQGEVA
jgi:hypothetical protein